MSHPLEKSLNAPAADIMEAISRGFRAQVDVKGKLAELYLARMLDGLRAANLIDSFTWNDKDGLPDFLVEHAGKSLVVEVKNVRSGINKKLSGPGWGTVELQKTRNGVDGEGKKTRGYLRDHFDVLGACLFNQTGRWEYRFAESKDLAVRAKDASVLEVFQRVDYHPGQVWRSDLSAVILSALARKT